MATTDEGRIRDALRDQQAALREMARRLIAMDPHGIYESAQDAHRRIAESLEAADVQINAIRVRGDAAREKNAEETTP